MARTAHWTAVDADEWTALRHNWGGMGGRTMTCYGVAEEDNQLGFTAAKVLPTIELSATC